MVNDGYLPHHRHATWFLQRAAHPMPDAHPGALELCWNRRQQRRAQTQLEWKCLGPFETPGRVTALIVHPSDPRRLYAGAASGGVWRSQDGGRNWQHCLPEWGNPNIGALAFDPFDPEIVYCATGEANSSPDCYSGSGLYVTNDGGRHWKVLAHAGKLNLPRRIGALYADPRKKGRLVLGGISLDAAQPSGLYYSDDGGNTWKRENFFSRNRYWCHAIVGRRDGALFAALNLGGAENGVWRKSRAGWQRMGKGMPAGDRLGRISLAISPSQPEVMYALVADRAGRLVQGVYRSGDGGESWESIASPIFAGEKQSQYTNCIAIHPEDPDTVACGITDIFVTRNGGKTWSRASQWNARLGSPVYVHADQHALVMPGGDLLYAGTDGGVFASEDMGGGWTARTQGMCSTMFYNLDVAQSDGRVLCGGTQDNGTLLTGVGDDPARWSRVLSGDGAWTAFDPSDEEHLFASTSSIRIFRHNASLGWGPSSFVDRTPSALTPEEHAQVAITVMIVNPKYPTTVWFGSRRLWRTTDDARTWAPASPVFDGSAITAIEIPPVAPDQVWVGTMSGGIFRSLDGGATWSDDISGTEVPARCISRIESHPRHVNKLVAVVAGSGPIPGDHVFYTEDGGYRWRSIQSRGMPDVAYHAAIFETHAPYRLFVAGDCGVWMTRDLKSWADVSGSLPNVMVTDLLYHHRDRALIAATYGRGVWRATVKRAVK